MNTQVPTMCYRVRVGENMKTLQEPPICRRSKSKKIPKEGTIDLFNISATIPARDPNWQDWHYHPSTIDYVDEDLNVVQRPHPLAGQKWYRRRKNTQGQTWPVPQIELKVWENCDKKNQNFYRKK